MCLSTLNFISAIFPVYLFIFIVFGLVFIACHRPFSPSTEFRCCCSVVFVHKKTISSFRVIRSPVSCLSLSRCDCVRVCPYNPISGCLFSVVMHLPACVCVCVRARETELYSPKLSLWFAICSSSVNRLGYVLSIELAQPLHVTHRTSSNPIFLPFIHNIYIFDESKCSCKSSYCRSSTSWQSHGSVAICTDKTKKETRIRFVFSIE